MNYGRTVIYTDETEINRDNIVGVLDEAFKVHTQNKADIEYLYNYYKGKQPILQRAKAVREDINNKVVVNRANEIVSFKVGYLMGEPIQYVGRGDVDSEAINTLNEYVFAEDKASKDKELSEWCHICGTSYRMILPDSEDVDESPFEIYTVDPRDAFVVYSKELGNKPLMGVKYIEKDNVKICSCYTNDGMYTVEGGKVSYEKHALGMIPIIEYPLNNARLGAFEIVLPLLDSINLVQSDKIDGVEQFIQALMIFKGVDIEADDFRLLKELGGLKVPDDGDVKFLVQELNQSGVQTLTDDMYDSVLTICGMPNRNGGSSTSDTGSAVIMRDGWSSAEARAKDSELMFKLSEKKALKLMLFIAKGMGKLNLNLSDIEIRFTRRNYENILQKSQVLTTMLNNEKIHPRLAFEYSNLFVDPELAYTESMDYYKAKVEETEQALLKFRNDQRNNEVN